MKTVIFAGGYGSRLSEYTETRPKPMVEIGGQPMLWHIMNIYAAHGFREFVVACGYKGEFIKEYFNGFYIRNTDYVVHLADGKTDVLASTAPDWSVGVIDTGIDTMTGGRLLRLREWLPNSTFMCTYGDGVADVDIAEVVRFHKAHGKAATITAVRPPARFGGLTLNEGRVEKFSEKPLQDAGWINGGFFVFEPKVFDYLDDDTTILERGPLERLARDGELMAYEHQGFWQCMDTLREKNLLESHWESGKAPWKVWE